MTVLFTRERQASSLIIQWLTYYYERSGREIRLIYCIFSLFLFLFSIFIFWPLSFIMFHPAFGGLGSGFNILVVWTPAQNWSPSLWPNRKWRAKPVLCLFLSICLSLHFCFVGFLSVSLVLRSCILIESRRNYRSVFI